MSNKTCFIILFALAICVLGGCTAGNRERPGLSKQVQGEHAQEIEIARAKLTESGINLDGCSLRVYETQGFLVVDFQPPSFWKKGGGGKVLFGQREGEYHFSYLVGYD